MSPEQIQALLIQLPVLIFSVVVHEVAHGWVALRQGDDTAYMLGRITLNPLPHVDPVGSVIVPLLFALTPGSMMLGWAKPVPVNPRKFREYRRGDILVSLAGVASNFALAIIFALLLAAVRWAAHGLPGLVEPLEVLALMCLYGVIINFALMVFNLIPIPPLDGSHVLYHLLPPRIGARYRSIGFYGLAVLMVLMYAGALRYLLWPAFFLASRTLAATALLSPR